MKRFGAIWRLLDSRQRRQLIALQFTSVLMALSTVGGIAAILPFFGALAEPESIRQGAVLGFLYQYLGFTSERDFVIALGAAFVVLVIVSNAVNLYGSLAMSRFAYEVGDTLRIALLNEYLHRGYAFHSRTNSSTLVSNVVFEVSRITGGILLGGLSLVTNLVTIVFILASLVILNPVIAAGAAFALGAGYALTYAAARRRLRRNGVRESHNLAQRAQVVNEGFIAIKEIVLRQAQSSVVDRFARYSRAISDTAVSTLAIVQVPRHILECTAIVCLVGAALHLSGGGVTAGNWLAQLSFTGLAAYRLLPAMQQAFAALVKIRANSPAFDNVAADLHKARTGSAMSRPQIADDAWRGKPHRDIRCENIAYRHTSDRAQAICDVTLSIPAGAIVGLIGPNGSGKTTLVDVLAGLLVPDSGRVVIDDVALDAANCRSWQSCIAYVPQDIVVFDATLAENIAFGVAPDRIDPQRLRRAIKLARLEECVAALPRGHQEVLGERGSRLSGGQRQRIGIARALYCDASFLIMDEATSALDGMIEQELMYTLESLRGRVTIVLIAHGLSAVRHCDLVLELQDGKLSEHGSYQKLLRSERARRRVDFNG